MASNAFYKSRVDCGIFAIMIDITALLPPLRHRNLIACPYCAKLFPDTDRVCRHCRVSIDENTRKQLITERKAKERNAIVVAIVLFLVLIVIFSFIVQI